ncbi:MAG: MATE family efflux transporter [Clostridium sp.]
MSLNKLEKESIWKLFISYALPSVFAMVVMSIYIVIDGIFVGQFVGPNALAAVNIALPVYSITFAISIMFSTGTFTVVGIQLGEGDIKSSNNSFMLGLYGLIIVNIVIAILIFAFGDTLARLLGASDLIFDQVKGFMVILALFAPGFGLSGFFAHGIRTMGYPNYSMMCNVLGAVLNIILDYIFIVKLGYGVEGAALGSGIAFTIAALVGAIPFIKKDSPLKFGRCIFNIKSLMRFIYNGASEALAEFGFAFTTFVFNIVLIRQIGESGVTAFSIVSYISSLVIAVYLGVSTGIGAIFSYNYGAKRFTRILKLLKISLISILILGVLCTLGITIFGKHLIKLFIHDTPDLLALTIHAANLYSLSFLISGLNILSSGFFTSIERPRESVLISILRGVIFITIFLIILPLVIGSDGIWLTLLFSELSTLIVSIYLLTITIKKLRLQT